MRANADITIYSKSVHPVTHSETWTRSQVTRVAWEDKRSAARNNAGELQNDEVVIYVPMARGTLSIQPGDVVVRGLASDEIGTLFTITDLRAQYAGSVATVRKVGRMDLGSPALRHWQIGCQ